MVARKQDFYIALTSILTVVFAVGCTAVDPEAGRSLSPESARAACFRLFDIFSGCPEFGLGLAGATPDACQELSATDPCEALSAMTDCYDGFDFCGLLDQVEAGGQGGFDPNAPEIIEVSECITDAMELDFASEACGAPFGLSTVSPDDE